MGIVREITANEEQLIARSQAGDNNAMYAIYNKYAKTLLNSSYRIVQNVADAEDITQEAFIDAFASLHKYSGTHSFEGWLRRIAINKSISFLRRKKYKWVDVENVPLANEAEINEIDEASFVLEVQKVKNALSQLPDQQRLVFTLFTIDDLPHAEIAEMLGIGSGNVRIIYHRAKNKILDIIKKEESCKNA